MNGEIRRPNGSVPSLHTCKAGALPIPLGAHRKEHTYFHTHSPYEMGGGGGVGRHDRPPGTAPNSVDPVEPHGFPVQGEKKKKKNLRIIHLVGA